MKRIGTGHVVFLTSVAGLTGIKDQMPLTVSQFAVQGIFESLFEELRLSEHKEKIKVSLVHIYPFIVSENLENDIRLRIPSYFGTMRAENAAAAILQGVRQDQLEFSVPSKFFLETVREFFKTYLGFSEYYFFIGNLLRIFPKKATVLLRELLDTGVDFG